MECMTLADHHKQTARDIIERMQTARPTCEKCDEVPYSHLDEVNRVFRESGWEDLPNKAGLVARCAECRGGRKFPWAEKLAVDRVAWALENAPQCQHAFDLAILEETLHWPKGAIGMNRFGNFSVPVYPSLRDAICKLCGKTGGEHVGIDGCPVAETKGFEFL